MMKSTSTASVLLCLMLCIGLTDAQAQNRSLNIILTNRDGFETPLIQRLFTQLKLAGHNVVMSAPYARPAGFNSPSATTDALRPITLTTANSTGGKIAAGAPGIGNTTIAPDQYYVDGPPTTAAFYGIDILGPRHFGAGKVDLLIAGPDEIHSVGLLQSTSGTVGSVVTVLNRGNVPAIAVSVDFLETKINLVGELVAKFIGGLNRTSTGGLDFGGAGLNVNIPGLISNNVSEYSFVGTNSGLASNAIGFRFVESLSNCPYGVELGANFPFPGVCVDLPYVLAGYPQDNDPLSEGNVVTNSNRMIAVTVIQSTYQAPPAVSEKVLSSIKFSALNGPSTCRVTFNVFDAASNANVGPYLDEPTHISRGVVMNPPCFMNIEIRNETCAVNGPMKVSTQSPFSTSRTENNAPYFLFGDNGAGDVFGAALAVPGNFIFDHEFNGAKRDGIRVNLDASFKMYNATSNLPIKLTSGATEISRGTNIPNPPCFMNFEILAPATCAAAGAMWIRVIRDGVTTISSRNETNAPYFAFGNGNGGDVLGQSLPVPGNYALVYRVPGGATTTLPFSLSGVCRP